MLLNLKCVRSWVQVVLVYHHQDFAFQILSIDTFD